MVDGAEPPGWRTLAETMPDCLGVQAGGEFVYVADRLAALAGATPDALTDECWRTAVDTAEAERLAGSVFPAARERGQWQGLVQFGDADDGETCRVRLSVTEAGAIVWTAADTLTADSRSATADEHERRYRADSAALLRPVLDAVDDVVYVIGEDGLLQFWNDTLLDVTGYSDEELAAMHPMTLIPEDQHEYVPGLMDAIESIDDRCVEVDILTEDGERISHEFNGTTFEDSVTGDQFRCGFARDITERLERERELERQRDELATLDRINELLLETVRALTQTASREGVERTICDRLTASDFYKFAWVGERAFDSDAIRPRERAGEGDGYLDAVTITADRSETGTGPAGRAMRTGEVQVTDIGDEAFEPWRAAASERGFESVAAVPLSHRDTVYGVLVVYATREDAFSPREQAGFDVLGRTVGSVIRAARSRKLLFADSVIELEFDVAEADFALVRAAAELDCTVELDGYVASGERWLLYVTVDGVAPDEAATVVASDPRIETARVIHDGGDGGRLELVVAGSSVLDVVVDAGATVRTAVATGDDATLVVEAPADGEIRQVVDHVRTGYPAAELVAHRERDREVTTVRRPDGVLDGLTDRQREAVETAYRAGYFAWPRASTAEEVAESLGLAAPTLHAHLRKAEQHVLQTLFDGE